MALLLPVSVMLWGAVVFVFVAVVMVVVVYISVELAKTASSGCSNGSVSFLPTVGWSGRQSRLSSLP